MHWTVLLFFCIYTMQTCIKWNLYASEFLQFMQCDPYSKTRTTK